MDAVYEELDEVKAELQKLKEQYRVKAELAENLKRAHNDQVSKYKEASVKLEKLAEKLNDKDGEISAAREKYDQLKSNLAEKESIIKHITSAHDKLRVDCNEKLKKFEEEKSVLASALDDANELREQYRVKVEFAESLKRAHNDQVSRNKDASFKLEKLTEELSEKDGEICAARQMFDELKSNLAEKESIIKHITSAHDKLRLDCNAKLQKVEEENKVLASALDDATAKKVDQEQQIYALKQEVEGVKRNLSFSQKKCSESESKTAACKELGGEREDDFFKLEGEKRKLEDQLKWKKEQFVHLEEAHGKLRKEYKTKEKEWEKEKGNLLHGISSLETKLESQTRISQDLQHRLEMCNHALAHAESKRKVLEVELLESRKSLDNVCAEYDEAKLNFENIAAQRDQEIATLRSSLGTKDILYKEMEYQFRKLEQEKQELSVSLKEFQEDQIRSSSASKLQNKLKSLEQVHRGCPKNLKAKESEWSSQMEKLSEELNYFKSELETRDSSLSKLNRELEACDSLIMKLELLNQETSLTLLVLKSEFSEERFRLADDHSFMIKQVDENMFELMEQLEQKKVDLNGVQEHLEEERQKVMTLSKKVQTLEELQFPLQKEVDRLKEMLKESTSSQLQSEEQTLLIQDDLKKVREALDRADEELYEKFCEANEIEFELRIWKSVAEKLEANLKQNQQMRKEVEASLLQQAEVELNLKQEKESLSHQLEEKERKIDNLQQQLVEVNASEGTFLAQVDRFRHEAEFENPESLQQLVEEKDQRICDLQQLVESLEHEFESSTSSFSSKLSQMQKEINVLRESWEKIKADEVLKEVEIQEKHLIVVELENDLQNLTQRVDDQDKNLISSQKKIQEIEDELQRKEVEVHRLECELQAKISSSEKTIKNLTKSNEIVSSQNQNLIDTIGSLSEKMEKLSDEDFQLMGRLGNIVKYLGVSKAQHGSKEDEEQENMNIFSSPINLMKKVEAIHDERSPLRAINN